MIETEGLTKFFGDFEAVHNVNLSVPPGTVLAILGPNGAGKTTTIRMLTSILAPTSGWAKVAGYDVVKDAARVRASVGVLTEQHGLYERMRGLEYLDFFGRIYHLPPNVRQARAEQLMTRFGLGDAFGKRVGEYSKGMKQKLALVRSLLHDPPVLLLDEPTSAMDPQSAKLVRDAIIELRQDKRTIILTTHNLTEAEALADNIGVIRRGRIVAYGDMASLATRFVGPPLMELKTSQPLNGLAKDLAPLVKVVENGENWLRYEASNPTEVNPQVLRHVLGLGIDVITLSQLTQTLEDVYLQIVEEDEGQEKKSHERTVQ